MVEAGSSDFKYEVLSRSSSPLYGVIEKIEQREEEIVYSIYANGKLYQNIKKNYILNDFGVLDE